MTTRLSARVLIGTADRIWGRSVELPIAPFPGLGVRVDTYDLVHVDSVVVGDPGFDVTCIGHLEDVAPEDVDEARLERLGFEPVIYP